MYRSPKSVKILLVSFYPTLKLKIFLLSLVTVGKFKKSLRLFVRRVLQITSRSYLIVHLMFWKKQKVKACSAHKTVDFSYVKIKCSKAVKIVRKTVKNNQ